MCFKSIEEIISNFDKDTQLNFYYPTIPHRERDEYTLKLLHHFPNAIMLCEKPSHNSAIEARAFSELLSSDKDRFLVGMHSSLHVSRKVLLEQVQKYKDEVESVSIHFNYPKNPHDPTAARVYSPPIGGVCLDLGVYVFQLASEIGEILGYKLHDFNHESKEIEIKYTQ
jgi:predicted dehydrogenase